MPGLYGVVPPHRFACLERPAPLKARGTKPRRATGGMARFGAPYRLVPMVPASLSNRAPFANLLGCVWQMDEAAQRGYEGDDRGLIRPCWDCGCRTGSWCDGGSPTGRCAASETVPSETWRVNQATPLCTSCDAKHARCHTCRGVSDGAKDLSNVQLAMYASNSSYM